ncbi:MAG: T9SS type A sorting domain-containing protein [candidate division WOR-3 bacterium]
MLKKCMQAILLISLPVFLYGWGNDVLIDVLRRDNNEWAVSYDVSWLDESRLIVGVGYNSFSPSDTSSYVSYYVSNDGGGQWQREALISWQGEEISKIQFVDVGSYLLTLWQGTRYKYAISSQARNNLTNFSLATFTEPDTIIGAGMDYLSRGVNNFLYIGVLTRNNTSGLDVIKLYKSVNFGAPQLIYQYGFSNTTGYYFLRDVDVTLKSDTAVVLLTVEIMDRSTNKAVISYRVIKEDILGNLYYDAFGWQSSFSYPLDASTSVIGGYALSLIKADGDLKCIFMSNYFEDKGMYNYPFCRSDSAEQYPQVSGWKSGDDCGFHMVYTRGGTLYYSSSEAIGSNLFINSPVSINDQFPVNIYNYYWFPRTYAYNPKVGNKGSTNVPVVVWPQDFWHIYYVYPWYDSTFFAVDHQEAVRINEPQVANKLTFSTNLITSGYLEIKLTEPLSDFSDIKIFNIYGRQEMDLRLPPGAQEYTFNIGHLRSGVYFISLRSGNKEEVIRFYFRR